MPTNTIEHPTWAETEYENLSRREARTSIVTQLAATLAVFGILVFGLATVRKIANRISSHEAECELIQVPCPDVKKAGQQ